MTDLRITSDPHLGHRLVSELRGFASIREHDDRIIHNLARDATEQTIWWFLGDIAFGDKAAGLRRLRDEVPGRKRLVLGNHDPLHPALGRGVAWTEWTDVFEQIHLHGKIRHDGFRFLASHFPYDGDHTREERFDQWRLRDHGAVLLHGHTHGAERVTRSREGSLQVHVGLDAWHLRPVTMADILDELGRHEDLGRIRNRTTGIAM